MASKHTRTTSLTLDSGAPGGQIRRDSQEGEVALSMTWLAVCAGLSVAAAQEPEMTVLDDRRTVQGAVEVQVDAAQARALVQDPHQTARASGDGDVRLEDVGEDGDCRLIRWTVPHPIKTVSYVGRFCETRVGVEIDLVESDDMAFYKSTWTVEPLSEDRVRLTCRVRSEPSFPLPMSVVRGQIKKELGKSLASIKRSLEGRR